MKKFSALLLAILMISALFLVTGCGGNRDENLIGRWVFEDAPEWVTIFNEDGTGTHALDWGYGTSFRWSTSRDRINWNYSGHPRLYTIYNISGGALYITMDDGTVFRYIRD